MTLSESPLQAGPTSSSASRAPFVLLVDDDDVGRGLISQVLAAAGHRCIEVGSVIEALDLCLASRPRMVITDLCMPGLDGRCLGRDLRARFPGLRMLLITAQTLDDDHRSELLDTFDEVMSKPLNPRLLLDSVSSLAS